MSEDAEKKKKRKSIRNAAILSPAILVALANIRGRQAYADATAPVPAGLRPDLGPIRTTQVGGKALIDDLRDIFGGTRGFGTPAIGQTPLLDSLRQKTAPK